MEAGASARFGSARFDAAGFSRPLPEVSHESSATPTALDAQIRVLCRELAERDLIIGLIAAELHRNEAWRRFGYATEAQWARERVGLSLTSIKAKRALAARAIGLPELRNALEEGRIGYEAARLVARIATRGTAVAWLARARERTVVQLMEEVEAAELFGRLDGVREQAPPSEDRMAELASRAPENHRAAGSARRQTPYRFTWLMTRTRSLSATGPQSGSGSLRRAKEDIAEMTADQTGSSAARDGRCSSSCSHAETGQMSACPLARHG